MLAYLPVRIDRSDHRQYLCIFPIYSKVKLLKALRESIELTLRPLAETARTGFGVNFSNGQKVRLHIALCSYVADFSGAEGIT